MEIAAVLCFAISLGLIIRLWVKHRQDAALRKVFWSLVLLIPLVGWIFYGGFYKLPDVNRIQAQGKASGWMPHWPRR